MRGFLFLCALCRLADAGIEIEQTMSVITSSLIVNLIEFEKLFFFKGIPFPFFFYSRRCPLPEEILSRMKKTGRVFIPYQTLKIESRMRGRERSFIDNEFVKR